MKILHWLVRILCVVGMSLFFVWVIDQNIALGGHKTVDYLFGDPGPIVSELQPVSRMGGKEYDDRRSFQKMFEDPVYFDLITPVVYKHANIRLVLNNHTSLPLRLGVRGAGNDDYTLYDLTEVSKQDGWSVWYVDIDLIKAGWEKGKYRFVISVPGLVHGNPEEYVALSSIQMKLYKDPITFASMKAVIGRALNSIVK